MVGLRLMWRTESGVTRWVGNKNWELIVKCVLNMTSLHIKLLKIWCGVPIWYL